MSTTADDHAPHPAIFVVPGEYEGQRLDRLLESLGETVPAGLRGRRRLCEAGLVFVDGRPAGPAYKVRAGQYVTVRVAPRPSPPSLPSDTPYIVSQTESLAALYKPAGWHSTLLAGSGGGRANSVEGFLTVSSPPVITAGLDDATFTPCLLNRLDCSTSGLLMAARSRAGQDLWIASERSGRISKLYVAVVEGILSGEMFLRQALDVADRAQVRSLARNNPDPLRHTLVKPLGVLSSEQSLTLFPGVAHVPVLSLVLCCIRMGMRHQIRAHLAFAGYPLFGDRLYGGGDAPRLLLHHIRLSMPGFSVFCPPSWQNDLPDDLAALLGEGALNRSV